MQGVYSAEKQNRSPIAYFMDLKKMYDELNVLLPFSQDVKVQQTQWEKMVVMSFRVGILLKFEMIYKAQILSGFEISSFQEYFILKALTSLRLKLVLLLVVVRK